MEAKIKIQSLNQEISVLKIELKSLKHKRNFKEEDFTPRPSYDSIMEQF